jgi:hypothetical protein
MSTKAQVKTQAKTQAAPAAAHIPQPPMAELDHEAEQPDIAAQLEGAARLGHRFGALGVDHSPPPIIQRQELPEEEEEELQMKREPAALQRQELPEEEEELIMTPNAQRVGKEGGPVSPEVEAAINRARGGGQPLEGAVQAQMSEALGHDFSRVRVHTDSEANDLNRQLSAKAFTTGSDIFFERGVYEPGSSSGRELIAHELSHVVQQSSGRVNGDGSGMTVRPAGEAFEQEADRVAEAVTRSMNTSVQRQTPEEEDHQRQPDEEAIQTNPSERQPVTGSEDLETRINSARGSGQSLSSDGREPREKEFGADFRDVRVHNGSDAEAHKKQLRANVFTIGSERLFLYGECAPAMLALQRAEAFRARASPAHIFALHRVVGNRAVDGKRFSRSPGREGTPPVATRQRAQSGAVANGAVQRTCGLVHAPPYNNCHRFVAQWLAANIGTPDAINLDHQMGAIGAIATNVMTDYLAAHPGGAVNQATAANIPPDVVISFWDAAGTLMHTVISGPGQNVRGSNNTMTFGNLLFVAPPAPPATFNVDGQCGPLNHAALWNLDGTFRGVGGPMRVYWHLA